MRAVVLGVLIGAGLVMAAAGFAADRNVVSAQVPAPLRPALPESQLIALSTKVGEQYQQLTVIDPRSRRLAVFHIDLRSGEVGLQSVRNIDFDLQMESFNTKVPLPQEVQSFLESQRR